VTTLVNGLIRLVVRILCKLDAAELRCVPRRGPLILVSNHINFLEVPILYTLLQPRPLIGLVKAETWDSAPLAFLANLWKAIPVRRGSADLAAFRSCLRVLREGKILAVAPEGTRSGTGRLNKGQPGVVHLALQGGFPVLPVVHYGGESFWQNLRRLRRTPVHVRVGIPFVIEPRSVPVSREDRWAMTHEIMHRIADLLPSRYHGFYDVRRSGGASCLRDVRLDGRAAEQA
jgi:1-acyl-sn-glycerol-3-phosphate acyltransferase